MCSIQIETAKDGWKVGTDGETTSTAVEITTTKEVTRTIKYTRRIYYISNTINELQAASGWYHGVPGVHDRTRIIVGGTLDFFGRLPSAYQPRSL